jgi:hypothetical protein
MPDFQYYFTPCLCADSAPSPNRASASAPMIGSDRVRLPPRGVWTKRLRAPVSTSLALASANNLSMGERTTCGASSRPKSEWLFILGRIHGALFSDHLTELVARATAASGYGWAKGSGRDQTALIGRKRLGVADEEQLASSRSGARWPDVRNSTFSHRAIYRRKGLSRYIVPMPNNDEVPWELKCLEAASSFAARCKELYASNPYSEIPLHSILNTLMTELWDSGFSQSEIREAFNDAVLDMPRYAAGEERRGRGKQL